MTAIVSIAPLSLGNRRKWGFFVFLKHAIKEYEFDCKARKLGVNTIQGYMRMLRYLMDYLDREYDITQIKDVKPFHIKHFLLLKQEEGKKPQYINDLLKVYKTFFRYLEEEEYLDKAPTAKIHNVKQPKVLIRTFSEDEIRRMLNYCNGRDFVSIRNKALLSILFDTGMRLNEVVSLKREQIHEEYILVHGKGNKERLVPVSPFLGKALMRYLVVRDSYFDERKIPEPYVFVSYRGYKMHQQFIGKLLKEIAEAVGVRKDIRVSPHTCRHTFAHLQLKNGLDLYSLSRLMGHESIAITQRYLDGIRTDQVLKAAQKTGVLENL